MSRNFLFLTFILLISTSCSTLNRDTASSWKHSAVFIGDARIDILRSRIEQKMEPTYTAWISMKHRCDRDRDRAPTPVEKWSVPGFYDGHEAQQIAKRPLENDATLAYEEALCFRLTSDATYARSVVRILSAWMETLTASDPVQVDSKLTMSYHFPSMIAAADLIRSYPDWSENHRIQFQKFIRTMILPLNTMRPKVNNHANWGMVLVLSAAAYLDDEALFNDAENRFKELIDIQIDSDGTLPNEIERSDSKNLRGGPTKGKNGLWYTKFALMPTTLSAEILRVNRRDVYDYRSAKGGNLKIGYEKSAHWSRYPEKFPFYESNHGQIKGVKYIDYFEILNVLWPNPSATELLEKLRPLTTETAFPDLTLTHGALGPQG